MITYTYVVLKQIPSGPCADCWNVTFVNIVAESAKDAIKQAVLKPNSPGEGRYVAILAADWIGQNVKIKQIAEISLETEDLT